MDVIYGTHRKETAFKAERGDDDVDREGEEEVDVVADDDDEGNNGEERESPRNGFLFDNREFGEGRREGGNSPSRGAEDAKLDLRDRLEAITASDEGPQTEAAVMNATILSPPQGGHSIENVLA